VDAPELAQALSDIQEGIAMALDEYVEKGWSLPPSVTALSGEPSKAVLPVLLPEHQFVRLSEANRTSAPRRR